MDNLTKNLLDLVFSGLQLLILFVSAVWAFFRFRKENPLHPRIEFDLKCKFFGPQQSAYLACLTVNASNKGNVEHRFNEIRLRALGIKTNEPLKEFTKYPPMVNWKNTNLHFGFRILI